MYYISMGKFMLELYFYCFRWLYYYMTFQLVYVYCSMSNLKNLRTLNMSRNNFSERLPDVFTSMTSLRNLYMENCSLSTLPERLVKASTLLVFCLYVYRYASPVAMY